MTPEENAENVVKRKMEKSFEESRFQFIENYGFLISLKGVKEAVYTDGHKYCNLKGNFSSDELRLIASYMDIQQNKETEQ